ncbi:hypothetical protein H6G89_17850 [Oscillatoria sp. FACHB-1407]|uniref:hypothetical protein n=1 Tax=Oscillatoria sp. FACHB-1407 TaxID=2692847 RepID=UPI0016834A70|nr:hypothetical protein [Oscillatoria sp. FACHB-1407]MBD2462907.1 hypothetical protein [Oscillatoria sp. FACHB-1407]
MISGQWSMISGINSIPHSITLTPPHSPTPSLPNSLTPQLPHSPLPTPPNLCPGKRSQSPSLSSSSQRLSI